MTEAELQADLHQAMRERDQRRIDVLRGIIAAAKNIKIEKRIEDVSESDLLALIRKEAKKRNDIIEFATKGGRDKIAAEAKLEKDLLETYLPTQIVGDKLAQLVRELAAELDTNEIGPIMGALRKRHEGCFDGKEASALIRALS